MKKIRKFDVSLQSEDMSNQSLQKGSFENPYTMEEYEQLHDQNLWAGGYVEGLGEVASDSSENNIHIYSQYDMIYYYGTWTGGYVEGWGYVGPETTIWPNSNTNSAFSNTLSLYSAFKQSLFDYASKSDDIGSAAKLYYKFNYAFSSSLWGCSVLISINELRKEGSTSNAIKMVVTVSSLALGPIGNIVYSTLEMTGTIDLIANKIGDEIDKIIRQ